MQANSANRILAQSKELISREINLCRNLRAMISRELEAIVLDGDMDALYEILERKDEVISQLQLLADGWRDLLSSAGINDVNNSNFPEGFGKYLLTLYPNDKELPELIQESREIAESIMKAEDEAVSELDKLSSGLRGQMVNRVQGRNAAASYARMGGSII
ncbi:MAG: flagellar export chaperone FlgN [Synergistaceae bacterium]|nr:flagellar export chaperone FlgN [Synergistaceae bacterium]